MARFTHRVLSRIVASGSAVALCTSCQNRVGTVQPYVAPGSSTPTLQGVMTVSSYTLPAAQTALVSAPAAIVSSGPVQIGGTLRIAAGATLAIVAPQIVVTGTLGPATTTSAHRRAPKGDTSGALPQTVMVSDNISFAGTVSGAAGGGSVAIVSPSGTGTLAIATGGTVRAPNGSDATQQAEPGAPGGATAGGNVEIGTAQAATIAGGAMALLGKTFAAPHPQFKTVTVNGSITGGSGGAGYFDQNGNVAGDTVTLRATSGAKGGDVDIVADRIEIAGSISGGRGGWPGDAGQDAAGHQFTTAVDAVEPGGSGKNVVATTGDGGPGGNVNLTGTINTTGTVFGGCGTSGAWATGLRAGNGLSGGNGGTTTIAVGRSGADGTPTDPSCTRMHFPALVSLADGGHGDTSIDAQHSGGAGGNVTIRSVDGGPATSAQIRFFNYANAGHGFSNCPNAGTNGGKSATLTTLGVAYTAKNAFNGGNGGAGNPPGTASTAGTDDTGKKVGNDGLPGNPCASPAPTATPPPTPTPTPSPAPTATASPTPSPTATPSPAASPTAPPLSFSPQALVGPFPTPIGFTVTETGFSGTLSVTVVTNDPQRPNTANCTVSPPSASGPTASFTLTPGQRGQCGIQISDGTAAHAIVTSALFF